MRNRRRERGSTILYAIILSGVAAALAVANLQVASSFGRLQDRREKALRWEYVKAAAAAKIETNIRMSPASDPDSLSLSVGGEDYNLAVSTTGTLKKYFVQLESERYGSAQGVAYDPRGKHPFLYGLFVDANADIKNRLTLGNSTQLTHLYVKKSISIDAEYSHQVYGAFDRKESAAPNFDRLGVFTGGVNRPNLAKPSALTYSVGANQTIVGSRTFNGGTFNSGSADAYVVSATGPLTITGTITGRVTFFSSDKILIQAPLRVANAASKIVLIAKNDILVNGSGQVNAFAFTETKLVFEDENAINWTGAIACNDYVQEPAVTLTLDPLFYDREELANFKVPRDAYGLD